MKTQKQEQQTNEIQEIKENVEVYFSDDGFVLVQKTGVTDTKQRGLISEYFTTEEIAKIEKIIKKKYWAIVANTYQYDHSNEVKTELTIHFK
jgi:hypothetical protein